MIHFLSSDSFSGQLRDPSRTGLNPLFRAKIRIGDASLHCYVKPIPDKVWTSPGSVIYESSEIMSEAIGHTLAKVVGLQVSKNVGVIQLDRAQIPEGVRSRLDAISPLGPQETYLAWFSEDTTHPNLYQMHVDAAPEFLRVRQSRRLAVALSKNASIPGIISFDAWLQNSDRHLSNLLWAAGGGYTLIDHGRLFVWPDWTPATLHRRAKCSNRLMDIIDSHVPQWSENLPIRSARLLAYNSFSVAFREKGSAAATATLSNFLDDEGSSQVVDFITSRLDNGKYSKELGMLAIS